MNPNRIVGALAYDGTHYAGWQWQLNAPTIQAKVEKAISQVATHQVRVMSAGRTDRGVHASYQIIHFDTVCSRAFSVWKAAINFYLPPDIRLLWIRDIAHDFHARHTAIERAYRYLIYQGSLPWFRHYSWMINPKLQVDSMQIAASDLIGEYDFSAFRAAQCQSVSPIRKITGCAVIQRADWIQLDIKANAFLHHMVRNIVGVLVEIGQGKRSADAIPHLLATCDRRQAGCTAPSQGLYLRYILYPEKFRLPLENSKDNSGL